MQKHISKYDHPIHLRPLPHSAGSKAAVIGETIVSYRRAGVWILHTPAMQAHKEFVRAVYEEVERLFPIGSRVATGEEQPPAGRTRSETETRSEVR